MLEASSWCRISVKRVYRIWRREGLKVPAKQPRMANDLILKDLVLDAAQETFRILLANPARFDPTRGTLRNFVLNALTKEAIIAVRAQHAPPGRRTRNQRPKSEEEAPKHKHFDTKTAALEHVAEIETSDHGRGAASTEATSDANRLLRLAGPTLAKALVAIAGGHSATEAALEIGLTRFQLRRQLTAFRAEVGTAA